MSNKNKPAISVIMPVYNTAKYLPLAIGSILNQTYSNFEFIIIDDGSSDNSWKIIKECALKDRRIKARQNLSNLGICRTLNYGLSLAQGKYIARMDGDDWSYPDRLFKQISFMKTHPKVVICGGNIQVCRSDLKLLNHKTYPETDKKIRESLLRMNPFAHPAIMYKKETVLKAGGYNEKLFYVEDYDLYFRLGNLGKFANIGATLLKFRVRYDSFSYTHITRQAVLHLYVRLKAIAEYGYSWHFLDFLYFLLELIGIVVVPARHKIKLYNFFRSKFQ